MRVQSADRTLLMASLSRASSRVQSNERSKKRCRLHDASPSTTSAVASCRTIRGKEGGGGRK